MAGVEGITPRRTDPEPPDPPDAASVLQLAAMHLGFSAQDEWDKVGPNKLSGIWWDRADVLQALARMFEGDVVVQGQWEMWWRDGR